MFAKQFRLSLLIAAISMALTDCSSTPTIQAGWKQVLSRCSDSGTLAGKTVYLGPSNSVGPGSIWRSTSDGGLNLRRLYKGPGSAVVMGEPSICSGSVATSVKLEPSLVVASKVSPLSVSVSAVINRATNVEVSVSQWALDKLAEGDFEDYIFSLPMNDTFRSDVTTAGRLVAVEAIRAKGMKVTLTFKKEDQAGARATLTPANLGGATVSPSLSVSWTSEGRVELTTDSEFYIYAEFAKFKESGFAVGGGKRTFEKVSLPPDAVLRSELQKD